MPLRVTLRGTQRVRSMAGFTLIELLIATVMLGLVLIAVMAISMSGVVRMNDETAERQADATTAQWSSMAFARDVQGASGVVAECAPGAGVHLLTVRASDDGERVEYRRSNVAPYALRSVGCDDGSNRTVVEGLEDPPTVACEAQDGTTGPCLPDTSPRVITMEVSRTEKFDFELDGARRTTDGNSADPPLESPTFVAIGGDTPLSVGGNSALWVVGNAYINRPPSGPAVSLIGGPGSPGNPNSWRLRVSGDFRLENGGTCPGCSNRSERQPGFFATRIPDPLRFLPAPDIAGLSVRTNCPITDGIRVCQPGIYEVEFPPAVGGGGVKDFRLQPGVYILRGGVKMTNGSMEGADVLLYNDIGDVNITGASLDLSPRVSGVHAGILFFQARDNTAGFSIVGNAALASLDGTIYAPGSNGVVLGGGGGTLKVGRVVGSNLSVSGNGTVIVDGS